MTEFKTHPDMREDGTMNQGWEKYTETDHQVWKTLYNRQMDLLPGRVCEEYLEGVRTLGIEAHEIPKFDELSPHSEAADRVGNRGRAGADSQHAVLHPARQPQIPR